MYSIAENSVNAFSRIKTLRNVDLFLFERCRFVVKSKFPLLEENFGFGDRQLLVLDLIHEVEQLLLTRRIQEAFLRFRQRSDNTRTVYATDRKRQ